MRNTLRTIGLRPRTGDSIASSDRRLISATDGPDTPIVQAYRELRTNLRFDPRLQKRDGGNAILLADAGGGTYGETADRSALVANLGIAYAFAGDRVVLVDADLRTTRPADGLSALFGQERTETGISAAMFALVHDRDAEIPLVATGVTDLLLLPTGPRTPHAADLFGADAFAVRLDVLRTRADIVLIDAPPILDRADVRAIAARTDGVLVLIAQGRTSRLKLDRALDALKQVSAPVIGAVLTDA